MWRWLNFYIWCWVALITTNGPCWMLFRCNALSLWLTLQTKLLIFRNGNVYVVSNYCINKTDVHVSFHWSRIWGIGRKLLQLLKLIFCVIGSCQDAKYATVQCLNIGQNEVRQGKEIWEQYYWYVALLWTSGSYGTRLLTLYFVYLCFASKRR